MLEDSFGMQLECWEGGGRGCEDSWHGSCTAKESERGGEDIEKWLLPLALG